MVRLMRAFTVGRTAWMTKGCLESNPGPLEKQPVLLTSGHHSNALTVFLGKEQG